MDEIEFVTSSGEPIAPDDELAPRPRGPRWAWLVAATAVLALVVGVLVSRSGRTQPSAQGPTTDRAPTTVPAAAVPTPTVPPGAEPPLPIGSQPVLDVALGARHSWVLQSDGVTAYDRVTGTSRHVAIRGVDPGAPQAWTVLVADEPRLWLVVSRPGNGGIALEYDAATLRLRRSVPLSRVATDAAVLDGHLYLATWRGLADIRPGGRRVVPVPGPRHPFAVAADLTKQRVIALVGAFPTRVWTYRPGAPAGVRVPGSLPFGNGSIGITHRGEIWVGGFGQSGPALSMLDPRGLRPVRRSPLVHRVGAGAVIVGSGDRDFWVRDGDGGNRLFCVDGADGHVAQTWTSLNFRSAGRGPVASRPGTAVVATGAGVYPLVLRGCAG